MTDAARCLLRDRYLQLWLRATHDNDSSTPSPAPAPAASTATFHMSTGSSASNTTIVKGTLRATDSENNRFRVDHLQTPMGVYDRAVLRGTDIDMIELSLS